MGLRKCIVAIIDKVAPEEMPDIMTPYKAMDLNSFEEYLEQHYEEMAASHNSG
jgi:hypothetical protein